MSAFDTILAAERSKEYAQRNIDLYTYYTMSLISQAEAKRKMKSRLTFLGLMMLVSLALLMIPFRPLTEAVASHLTRPDWLDFAVWTLVGYGLALFVFMGLRGVRVAFR
jgi:hypothetical protein